MARLTYVPGLKTALRVIQRFVTDHKAKLEQNIGVGLYTAIEFILDLVGLVLTWIDVQDGIPGDAFTPLTTLSSQQINAIEAAIAKWRAANGLEA